MAKESVKEGYSLRKKLKKFELIHKREFVCILICALSVAALLCGLFLFEGLPGNIISSVFSSVFASSLFALVLEIIETRKYLASNKLLIKKLYGHCLLLRNYENDAKSVILSMKSDNGFFNRNLLISSSFYIFHTIHNISNCIDEIRSRDELFSESFISMVNRFSNNLLCNQQSLLSIVSGAASGFNPNIILCNGLDGFIAHIEVCYINNLNKAFYS
ncbi:MAG: hypothetical protein MJ228_03335 [Bacilli bacterium]|nr:hypothetical protein [Bacilli bacterium]